MKNNKTQENDKKHKQNGIQTSNPHRTSQSNYEIDKNESHTHGISAMTAFRENKQILKPTEGIRLRLITQVKKKERDK